MKKSKTRKTVKWPKQAKDKTSEKDAPGGIPYRRSFAYPDKEKKSP